MGKLINMMQSNLFGKKKTLENNEESANQIVTSCSLPPVTFTIDSKKERKDMMSSDVLDTFEADGIDKMIADEESQINDEKRVDMKNILENYNNKNIEEKLYELERCYLFEQNNLIDKYELEKCEMLARNAEEKLLVKRAYEHEKDELLKEIERKDKMLFELTAIMKEEYSTKLQKQKDESKKIIADKQYLFGSIEDKLKTIIESLRNFFKNNEGVSESFSDFKQFLGDYELFLSSIASEKISNELTDSRQFKSESDAFISLRRVERMVSEPILKTTNSPEVTTYDNVPLNIKRQAGNVKVVTRTLSDNICLKNECCRKHSRDCNNGDEAIQHELAQAYRKQKAELLKLFNSEKEEYEEGFKKEKDIFERETRTEYVKRMSVERKAWQETIEDYEREVMILKYERQQMDTNYCKGMDKMKTEFEREKNVIHRRYNESCIQLKKNQERKIKKCQNYERNTFMFG